MRTIRTPSLETVVAFVAVTVGVISVASPITDNSMLLHLRTGMEIFRTGDFPKVDNYSFTAAGQPWTVQSWFAEVLYIAVQKVGGWPAVIFLQMILAGGVAAVMATLARTGSMLRTALVLSIAVTMAFPFWHQRPLLFGFLCFAVALLIFERKWNPLWYLPLGWIWLNTHGSFPLIFICMGATIVGQAAEGVTLSKLPWKYPALMAAGIGLGVINPYGVDLITFPFRTLGAQLEVFNLITEWRAPNFHSASGIWLLLPLIAAVIILARHQVSWVRVLPVASFMALALYSQRNLPFLAIVLCLALAEALRTSAPSTPPSTLITRAAIAVLSLVIVGAGVRVVAKDSFDFAAYPVDAYAWADVYAPQANRILAPDFVGCWRLFVEPGEKVFIDDRFDMYPEQVSNDYLIVRHMASKDPSEVIARYDVEMIIWRVDMPLHHFLSESPAWKRQWSDGVWSVFLPTNS